jgi:ferritin-like metal-binding protein YciE
MYLISNISETNLDPTELRQFFINHLNRIYCAKSQLADKLPMIGQNSNSPDVRQAISQTTEAIKAQLKLLKDIYIRLDAFYKPESCVGLLGFLDEAFQSIGPPLDSPPLRDLSISFYMQNIESIEMTSFQVMMRVADKLNEWDVTELLKECYEEARQNKALFNAICGHYL